MKDGYTRPIEPFLPKLSIDWASNFLRIGVLEDVNAIDRMEYRLNYSWCVTLRYLNRIAIAVEDGNVEIYENYNHVDSISDTIKFPNIERLAIEKFFDYIN